MNQAVRLSEHFSEKSISSICFGVCATCDPRVDNDARKRTQIIVEKIAKEIANTVNVPSEDDIKVVWTPILIDSEKEADEVAKQFKTEGVNIIVCTPDTWAFPQLTLMSLMAHFPPSTPLNITCGNSAPKPGVVFAHAVNGAFAQQGRLTHLNIGSWTDKGMNPDIKPETITALIDWCYAAATFVGLKGKRIVSFGHDSMGMETALTHVNATRNTFGLEITRLDMKLLSDKLQKKDYDKQELKELRHWVDSKLGNVEINTATEDNNLNQSLSMYLIMRDLLTDINAVGGAFMNQLEWGSDPRAIALPICDLAESLFNSTVDHNGQKKPVAFGTENDIQGTLTMLFKTWLTGGNPPLFMDFRKVWEPWELQEKAAELGLSVTGKEPWLRTGFVDGNNSGSASLDWAGLSHENMDSILKRVSMPLAESYYFPGGGNSVTFVSPGGIDGIASRLTYSELTGMFNLIWDEATTIDLPPQLAEFIANSSNVTWPHTWVVPKYATMSEYKQYAPANHFHMTAELKPSVLQYWMDLTNVVSVTPWKNRPQFIEGINRPTPLLHLINGGEYEAKRLRCKGV